MRTLQVLMPMGGLGSRFAKAGYKTPKPLINVDGRPMFLKAISSFDNIAAPKTFTFVIRQEHVDQFSIDRLITDALPGAIIVVIPKLTRGAAETALQAYPKLNPDDGLVVMDCDLYFESPAYDIIVNQGLTEDGIDGALVTFSSSDPRYSYAETNKEGDVTRTAEKDPISNKALIGAYFFSRADSFKRAADELLSIPISDTMQEYYMSLVYNSLLRDNLVIKAAPSEVFHSFGTPEELNVYRGANNE